MRFPARGTRAPSRPATRGRRATPAGRRGWHPAGGRAGSAPREDGRSGGAALPGRSGRARDHFTDSTVRKATPPLVYGWPVIVTVSPILEITPSGRAVLSFVGRRMWIFSDPFSRSPTGMPFLAHSMPHCLWLVPLAPMAANAELAASPPVGGPAFPPALSSPPPRADCAAPRRGPGGVGPVSPGRGPTSYRRWPCRSGQRTHRAPATPQVSG